MQSFDLIVIGSGPAGQRAAIQGAKLGKKVALIEKTDCVGGACINTGTIPKQDHARGRAAPVRLLLPEHLRINYRVKDKITMADLSFRVQHVYQDRDRCH